MPITSEIINIGDELLIGQVVNSNASYLAASLNGVGIEVQRVTVIADRREAILSALSAALEKNDVVLITGGLGPTNDDITKHVLCDFFNSKLVFSQDAFDDIERMFALRRFPVTETNRQQAMLPDNCQQIPNSRGTARGMWFERNGKVAVSMPGVPFEMTAMMEQHIVKMLHQHFMSEFNIIHRTVMCTGVGESFLAEKIAEWENQLPECLSLAYLPSPGIVRLRLTGKSHDETALKNLMDKEIATLKSLVPEYIFADKDIPIENFIIETLTARNQTLSTAESCTGGYIAHLLTSVSGSSQCYKGSIIAYNNEVKINLLDVSEGLLEECGAVSEPVVRKMAETVRQKLQTEFGIAVSGIAGPTGAVEGKPVGTVWVAVSDGQVTVSECFHYSNDRIRNIQRSAVAALNLLRQRF
ncbi:MAG: competence/damage-inducible protein A [Bacteroidales bacterium]|nr:competence/damage-inducible protein A [Bacteroidales bacterium]